MRRHLTLALIFTVLSLITGWSQNAPQGFNYQSVVRDANGNPLANQTITFLMSIRSGAANGPTVYTERHIANTDEYGLTNLAVGRGEVLQGNFSAINWGGGPKYLSVSVETAPNVFDELGTTELLSVPFALYAQNGGGGGGGGGDNWGTQTAATDPSLKGNGTVGNPLGLASQDAQPGQVLKWTGTAWVPQDDIASTSTGGGTVTQILTNSGIVGGPITTTGTIGLSNTGVAPGTYGSATQIPVFTVDAQGRISNVFTVVPSPGTIGINGGAGIAVQQNGTSFTVTNTGDVNPADDITTGTQAGGDLSGPFSNLQIRPETITTTEISDGAVSNDDIAANAVATLNIANGAVTAAKLNNMGATNGQVLKWNGTAWAPAADQGGTTVTISGGAGIAITGAAPNYTVSNTGDTNPNDDLTTSSTAAGDVTGPFSNLQIAANAVGSAEIANDAVGTTELANSAVTGAKINSMGATNGQVLKWNGTTWAPAADQGGSTTITAGAGIAVFPNGNNFTISNEGDIDALDDVTNVSQANGDLTGVFSNLQIKAGVVGNTELANNSVSTANIINGSVTAAKLASMGAQQGQVLTWSGVAWAPANAAGGAGDNWGTQSAQTNATLTGNGTALNPLGIAQQNAQNGQVLTWNGNTWAPANAAAGDNWGTQTAVTNATLAGNGTNGNPLGLAQQGATDGQVLVWNGSLWAPGTIPGDDWGTQSVQTSPVLSGNGTNASPLTLAQQGATNGQVLTWTASGWQPAGVNGDNWGTQSVQTNASLAGNGTNANPLRLAPQGAANGQVLTWNGANWVPGNVSGDNWGTQTVNAGSEFEGEGTNASPLQLAQQGATFGQTLKWNGSQWAPADDIIGSGGTNNNYASGNGISITGTAPNFTINNTGDLSNTNELQTISLAGNTLNLSNGGGSVVLPGGNTYTGGTAINVTGTAPNFVINNTGDVSNTNELQTISLAGNTLSLSNGGGSVVLPASGGNDYSAGTGISITGTAPNLTIANTGDLSTTNELQTISLAGNVLSLSNGGGAVNIDPSATNEIQTLSLAGNTLSLSNGGGSVALPASNTYTAGTGINITGTAPNFTVLNTGDLSATNELQNLQLNGTTLKITGTNSTVKFDTLFNNGGLGLWKGVSNNVISNVSGNVGINTETPSARLTVKNGGETIRAEGNNPMISLANSSTGINGFLWQRSNGLILGTQDSSSVLIQTAGPSAALTVGGVSGNVLIGNGTLGAEKLKVVHNNRGFMLQNGSGANWEFWVADGDGSLALFNNQTPGTVPVGIFATNGVYTASDRRLKKDITALPSVLGKISQLRPVSYHYKHEKADANLSLGFIAQEVQALFPELVTRTQTRDQEGSALLVNYSGLSVLAIRAIQEQQSQIDQLKTENNQLRARLDAIEARLNKQ